MSEKLFWNEASEGMEMAGVKGHFSRVESPQTSAGIPDVDFCIDGISGHVELKFGKGNQSPNIRDSQLRWFTKRLAAGGHPVVFAKLVTGDVSRYCLYHGSKIRKLWEAKTSEEWATLADYCYIVPHWGLVAGNLKSLSKGENP